MFNTFHPILYKIPAKYGTINLLGLEMSQMPPEATDQHLYVSLSSRTED